MPLNRYQERKMAVSTTATIDAPIEKIWGIIANFANLKSWHPMIKECVATGEGQGAVRRIEFEGWWVTEVLSKLDNAGHALAYLITESSRPETVGAFGTMALTALGAEQTRLDWRTRQAEGNPREAELDAQLANYYPQRINHLRAALGLPAKD
jgi:uncharacterized protein YndB with AHSA1/START domain